MEYEYAPQWMPSADTEDISLISRAKRSRAIKNSVFALYERAVWPGAVRRIKRCEELELNSRTEVRSRQYP
jgi:hypothetical protein